MNRKLYVFFSEKIYGTVFVDESGNFVHYIHENDGAWRSEYHNPIVRFFGGEVAPIAVNGIKDVERTDDAEDFVNVNKAAICTAISNSQEKANV